MTCSKPKRHCHINTLNFGYANHVPQISKEISQTEHKVTHTTLLERLGTLTESQIRQQSFDSFANIIQLDGIRLCHM